MAVSHLKYNVKGLQFHPESFLTGPGKQILQNWLHS
jgi:anthranilate synthase component II